MQTGSIVCHRDRPRALICRERQTDLHRTLIVQDTIAQQIVHCPPQQGFIPADGQRTSLWRDVNCQRYTPIRQAVHQAGRGRTQHGRRTEYGDMQGLQFVFQLGGKVQVADQLSNALALLAYHRCFATRRLRQGAVRLQLGGISLHKRQRRADIVRHACNPFSTCAVALVQQHTLRKQLV